MNALSATLIATISIVVLSLIAVLLLSLSKNYLKKSLSYLVALAAGTLLGAAFFHLMPSGLENMDSRSFFAIVLFSFIVFLILEKFLYWRHCHDPECEVHTFGYMNLIGDAIHNFIDGIIIASGFYVDTYLGIVTTVAILFHEVPQELGDFGVLLYSGFTKKKALFYNFLSSLTVILGGIVGIILLTKSYEIQYLLLPIAAGNFLYIAMVDLIPELRSETDKRKSLVSFAYFVAGLMIMYLVLVFEK